MHQICHRKKLEILAYPLILVRYTAMQFDAPSDIRDRLNCERFSRAAAGAA